MDTGNLPTRFGSVLDLARLPWFEVRDGNRLVLVDDTVGPIIDMHTHLAMGYLRPLRVDLGHETPTTAYYLPLTLPVDLDIYANKNLDASSRFAMTLDLSALSLTGQGMRTTHTAPNLTRDLGDMGIVHAVVLPIDLPVGPRNADAVLEISASYGELIPFGSVHPLERETERKLAAQKSRGAAGVKVHPAGQFIAPDHPRTIRLCGQCGRLDLPVLFHCGPVGIEPKAGRRRSQVARYERVIAENPETTFVLGHAGALQHEEAVAYAGTYENTYFELSCLGLSALRHVLEVVPPHRLLYGTDWPFYHQSLTLARVLMLTADDPPLRRAILFDNAARLLGLGAPVPSA